MPALPHHKGILVGEIGKSDFPVFGKMPVFVVYLHQYGLAGGGGMLNCCSKFARLPYHHPWVSPASYAQARRVFDPFLHMLHTIHFVQGFALHAVIDANFRHSAINSSLPAMVFMVAFVKSAWALNHETGLDSMQIDRFRAHFGQVLLS